MASATDSASGAMVLTADTGSAATSAARDAALEKLAADAGRRGFALALGLTGNAAEAEDAVQEALAEACAAFSRLREPDALESWFFRVLTRTCIRGARRRRARQALARLWPGPLVRGSNSEREDADVCLAAPDPRAVAADDRVERLRAIAAAIGALGRLTPRQRAAVLLRYGDDRSIDDIAAVLGIGRGTVKTHLVRALSELRFQLGGRR